MRLDALWRDSVNQRLEAGRDAMILWVQEKVLVRAASTGMRAMTDMSQQSGTVPFQKQTLKSVNHIRKEGHLRRTK